MMGKFNKGDHIKARDEYYEVDYIIHSDQFVDGDDVYACHALSHTDGMPIGPQVWIAKRDVDLLWRADDRKHVVEVNPGGDR
jgi:hypothetical protein